MHALEGSPAPIERSEDGLLRVTGTRVSLDVIVAAFEAGATPEELVQQYPTLSLAAAYATIAWALAHPAELREYLARRAVERDRVLEAVERRTPAAGVRARLLERGPLGR